MYMDYNEFFGRYKNEIDQIALEYMKYDKEEYTIVYGSEFGNDRSFIGIKKIGDNGFDVINKFYSICYFPKKYDLFVRETAEQLLKNLKG